MRNYINLKAFIILWILLLTIPNLSFAFEAVIPNQKKEQHFQKKKNFSYKQWPPKKTKKGTAKNPITDIFFIFGALFLTGGILLLVFVNIVLGVIILIIGLMLLVLGGVFLAQNKPIEEVIKPKTEETITVDVVYLKNGSIVKGQIVEQIIGVSIKIETRDGSMFVYKADEVEKITKEKIQKK